MKRFTVIILFAFLAGCAALGMQSYGPEDVEKAQKKGDAKLLADVCSGAKSARKGTSAKQDACGYQWLNEKKAELDAWGKAGELEKLANYCAQGHRGDPPVPQQDPAARKHACELKKTAAATAFASGAGSCETVRDAWAARVKAGTGDNAEVADAAVTDYEIAVEKYLSCGHWDDFFEDLLLWSPGFGAADSKYAQQGLKAMRAAQEKGVDLEAQILAYLGRKLDKAFPANPFYGVNTVVSFLMEQNKLGLCAKLAPSARPGDPKVNNEWLKYFESAGCKEGLPLALANLQAEALELRVLACRALGKLGTKAENAKVKAVADGDATFELRDKVQVYPARDACAEALAQIKSRGK
jgi:hypothetical protein